MKEQCTTAGVLIKLPHCWQSSCNK